MKTIGLLGGTSWPSTIEYYRILNELAQESLGGFHSANLILRSIDYHEIKSRYWDRWSEIPALLQKELLELAALRPDCILICNNTLHKAYDAIAAQLDLGIPVIHMVEATGRAARAKQLRRVLLLGTKFTMEDGFYHRGLAQFGLHVETPNAGERTAIQQVQTELARGTTKPEFRTLLAALISRYEQLVDGVVLACTELPLAIAQNDCRLQVLNPTELQCREALAFATGAARV